MAQADTKPRPITLKVKDSESGTVTEFRVKMTTKMGKVMDAYLARKRLAPLQWVFLSDEDRISKDDTPTSLDMEDGDEIVVVRHQEGGGLRPCA